MEAFPDGALARRHGGAARGHAEHRGVGAVRAEHVAENPGIFLAACGKHYGARTVAEQHAGGAVFPVEHRAHLFGADHQRIFVAAGGHHAGRRLHAVDESGTRGPEVEARYIVADSEFGLQNTRGGGKKHVGADGRHNDEIYVMRREPRAFDCGPRGFQRHIGGRLAGGGYAAALYAGPSENPFVARVHDLREVVVGDDFLRHVFAGAFYYYGVWPFDVHILRVKALLQIFRR